MGLLDNNGGERRLLEQFNASHYFLLKAEHCKVLPLQSQCVCDALFALQTFNVGHHIPHCVFERSSGQGSEAIHVEVRDTSETALKNRGSVPITVNIQNCRDPRVSILRSSFHIPVLCLQNVQTSGMVQKEPVIFHQFHQHAL